MTAPAWGCALLVGFVLAVLFPTSASAITGPEAVAQLNAQRAANGIPGDLVERPDWTAACANHNEYMRLNNEVEHHEFPNKPGYSEEGLWAAQNAVLGGGPWPPNTEGLERPSHLPILNPWENAPFHLMQLLSPKLAELGASDASGHICATTWPGYTRPAPATPGFYSYPGNGARDVWPAETARERPYVPGDLVGLPQGTRTGPHLYVMTDAPEHQARLTGVSLVGPAGPVDIRVVDHTTPGNPDLPTGGIIIPVSPLERATVYQASATVTTFVEGTDISAVSGVWSFRTELLTPTTRLDIRPDAITARTNSSAPVEVRITRVRKLPRRTPAPAAQPGDVVLERTFAPGETVPNPAAYGRFVACFSQPETDRHYGVPGKCILKESLERPRLRLKRIPGVRNGQVAFTLRAGRELRGRRARVVISRERTRCKGRGRCSTKRLRGRRYSLRLRASQLVVVPAPGRWEEVFLSITTPEFKRAGILYRKGRVGSKLIGLRR